MLILQRSNRFLIAISVIAILLDAWLAMWDLVLLVTLALVASQLAYITLRRSERGLLDIAAYHDWLLWKNSDLRDDG